MRHHCEKRDKSEKSPGVAGQYPELYQRISRGHFVCPGTSSLYFGATAAKMTFMDVLKIVGTIMASLGGGGAIVYGLSGFLGKIWADRALQDDRHKYDQLNLKLQNQLADNSRLLQLQLDAIGLVHNLRIKEEFTHLAALWKSFAVMDTALHEKLSAEILFNVGEGEKWKSYKVELIDNSKKALSNMRQILAEEMIFLPVIIAGLAEEIAEALQSELLHYVVGLWIDFPEHETEYRALKAKILGEFAEKHVKLEGLIRAHIRGEKLATTTSKLL